MPEVDVAHAKAIEELESISKTLPKGLRLSWRHIVSKIIDSQLVYLEIILEVPSLGVQGATYRMPIEIITEAMEEYMLGGLHQAVDLLLGVVATQIAERLDGVRRGVGVRG